MHRLRKLGSVWLVALVVGGCGTPSEGVELQDGAITRWHDDEKGVTCWVIWGNAVSCLPDEVIR